MKGLYWRPKLVSQNVLVLIALLAVGGILAVELLQVKVRQDYYTAKLKAARLMETGMKDLAHMRERLGIPVDPENDPTRSGLIGVAFSELTSSTGYLESKQTTVNPNFAAVAVHLLKKAGVEKGDVIAVGFSGSFPALNLAVLCACEALEVTPLIVSSAAASEWGANIRNFTWLEMERHLIATGLTKHRTLAASIGGVGDKGHGMDRAGKEELKTVIAEAGIPLLWPKTMEEGVEERMAIYEEAAGERPMKVYINVGGGTLSVGTAIGKRAFKPGLNRKLPSKTAELDSIMVRFAMDGIPVIHFTKIKELAEKYGLPSPVIEPQQPGKGNIFYKVEYNRFLVAGILAVLIACLWLLVRMNLGHRFVPKGSKPPENLPEPMV